MSNVLKFRSEPAFESRHCPRCERIGMPDEWQWWPIDETYWYRVNGRLDLRMCRACRSETQMEYKRRCSAKRAANDDCAQQVAA